jgi:hypothetical protein
LNEEGLKDKRQERERHGEQQAMGVGTVMQGLQCLRTKAPRGYDMIEIQRRPPMNVSVPNRTRLLLRNTIGKTTKRLIDP